MLNLQLPVTLAAGTTPGFFSDTAALIVAGALIAYICFRLRLVPIIGFLLAGILIGPNALGLIHDRNIVDALAEIGVILLLFTIGIEFSLEKLTSIQKLIFGGGIAQVGLSIAVTAGVLMGFGIDWRTGIFTGMLVALSSTAIVLKLLADNDETGSEPGRAGVGLLIFQDLAIVAMVLMVPALGSTAGGGGGLDVVIALAKAVGIIVGVLLIARRIMPKVLEMVARTCSPELFLLTVIAICFGTAYLTSLAGVSLSLGAFLAGLMVSESRFSHHALSETLPLQILFSATFFVSVGMLLDVGFMVRNLPIVGAVVASVLVIKIATTWLSIRMLGYAAPTAAVSALMLAQIGEFSFVLERAGRDAGLTPAGAGEAGSQTFIASTVVLMALTPFLMRAGSGISGRIAARRATVDSAGNADEASLGERPALEDHVIVAGFGQAARGLVRVLAGSGIPFIITTLSPGGANEAEANNLPVVRGDASKQFLLEHVGIANAKMMVIADDNTSSAHRIVSVARQINPTMRIVVRTRYIDEIDSLTEAGADAVIAEELESIVQLFGEVLRDYRIPAGEIQGYEDLARRDGYSALFEPTADPAAFRCHPGEDCFDSRTVSVKAGSPVIGSEIASLKLDEDFRLKVRGVRRHGKEIVEPLDAVILEPEDELLIEGDTEAFAASAALFRTLPGGNPSAVKPRETPQVRNLASKPEPQNTRVDVDSRIAYSPSADSSACSHLDRIKTVLPSAAGCEECIMLGTRWVHLRLCLTCGHVGCCDTSEYKHATAHFHDTEHPIVKSLEPQDSWAWCYADEEYV